MKEKSKIQKIVGISILIFAIIIVIFVKTYSDKKIEDAKLTYVYSATGGGKENLLDDAEFNNILKDKYKIKLESEPWSNGKLVLEPVRTKEGSPYDLIFFSDQRFYDYYKLSPNKLLNEADRDKVLKGGLTLNTPIVIYSWDTVTDAFIREGIVTKTNNVYYITDMNKLLNYILTGKTWNEIGVNIYGRINIDSTDPVTSSPGATYYGLLLSIMNKGDITDENVHNALPDLKSFYKKSGYMNNTPADLFEMYLRTGEGAKPMIVDYEKSIIDFANNNKEDYEKIKDKIRILYPTPTIWNSHCIATLSENGNILYNAFEDKEISKIAWSRYGFRTGITGGNYDVKDVIVKGIPSSIDSVVSGLKMSVYNTLIDYLKE